MKKALIFIASFMVSTMVIYSVYYYSKVKGLKGGVVATAEDLPNTVIGHNNAETGKNYIRSTGLYQAGMPVKGHYSSIPDDAHISLNSAITEDAIENLNRDLVRRFPKHPPLGFPHVKENGKVLFSYFFKNIELPENFDESSNSIAFAGRDVDALKMQGPGSGNSTFHKKGNTSALRIILSDSFEVVYFTNNDEDTFGLAALISDTSNEIPLTSDEYLLIPEIDISIGKNYTANTFPTGMDGRYAHVEERIKLKTSVQKLQEGRKESEDNGSKVFEFNAPLFFMMKRTADAKPYFFMKIVDPELLLKTQKGN